MFRNMVTSLFKYDRIRTTDAKAKALRGWADHIVTLAKRGDLHARRQALSIIREQGVVHRLFDEARDRFGNIDGGYTRIIKVGRRPGDAASMSMIELVAADKSRKPKAPKAATSEAPEKPMVESAAPAAEQALAETEAPAPEGTAETTEAAEVAAAAPETPETPETEAGTAPGEGAPSTETKTEDK
jgi:large subunit ribosomal protein L17